ncbi:MAG: hypothetical protein J7484_13030 [Microbacterium sp.]|nr:hypothetical protein [Microbacterium sp.]
MSQRSDPRDIERVAFEEVGRKELGLRVWDESREAAEQAWRECRGRLRARYGGRDPHWGWMAFALLAAALCAAVAAAMTSGFRSDPADKDVVVLVLVSIAAVLELAVVAGARTRPLGAGSFRSQLVVTVGLVVAAAFQLSRGGMPSTPVVVAAALVGVGGMALFLLVRALRAAEREEIDTAINVAVAEMRPEVDAAAARLQAQVLAELSPPEQERIVALRTQWAPSVDPQVPAGGVIIASFLTDWNSYLRSERERV